MQKANYLLLVTFECRMHCKSGKSHNTCDFRQSSLIRYISDLWIFFPADLAVEVADDAAGKECFSFPSIMEETQSKVKRRTGRK